MNFRLISNAFCLFFTFPLLSVYSSAIPFPNPSISSGSPIPIQAAQIISMLYNELFTKTYWTYESW